MAVLLSFGEEFHVRLRSPATTLIRWQPASHFVVAKSFRIMSRYEDAVARVAKISRLAKARGNEGLGHKRRGRKQ
jgi:hypothetical protein